MSFLFPSRAKNLFSEEEKKKIVDAIQHAEKQTSGEIRVFIESKCRFVDPVDRAKEVFFSLDMQRTEARNGTLLYLAVKHRQAAVFGDQGIHEKVGEVFWQNLVHSMMEHYKEERLADGICHGITELGSALASYFPYNQDTDKNELPDEIVFGR